MAPQKDQWSNPTVHILYMEKLRPSEGKGHDLCSRVRQSGAWDLMSCLQGQVPIYLPDSDKPRQCQMRTARSLNEGSLAEDVTTAGDENFRAGNMKPARTCLLCEVDTNCSARESLITGASVMSSLKSLWSS